MAIHYSHSFLPHLPSVWCWLCTMSQSPDSLLKLNQTVSLQLRSGIRFYSSKCYLPCQVLHSMRLLFIPAEKRPCNCCLFTVLKTCIPMTYTNRLANCIMITPVNLSTILKLHQSTCRLHQNYTSRLADCNKITPVVLPTA